MTNTFEIMRKQIKKILALLFVLISMQSVSQLSLPETSGVRGFVRPSFGYLTFSNNMVASFLRYDLANPQIKSIFTEPESQGMPVFLLPFDINYTFAKSKTQLFAGMQLDDLIRFNLTQQVGVKQQFKKAGIFNVSLLLNGMPTMVWEDPCMADTSRSQTDRHSFGLNFTWDLIFNSNFRFRYTIRRIRIGEESSGQYIGLSEPNQALLNRNGYMHNIELLYWIKLKKKQLLAPAILLVLDKRDGAARSHNAIEGRLNYTCLGKQFTLTANSFFGFTRYAEENPIYGKTQQDIYFSTVATVYYKNPWGWKIGNSEPMSFFLNAAVYRSDTNIDFYYRDAFLITTGVFFRWAKKG